MYMFTCLHTRWNCCADNIAGKYSSVVGDTSSSLQGILIDGILVKVEVASARSGPVIAITAGRVRFTGQGTGSVGCGRV